MYLEERHCLGICPDAVMKQVRRRRDLVIAVAQGVQAADSILEHKNLRVSIVAVAAVWVGRQRKTFYHLTPGQSAIGARFRLSGGGDVVDWMRAARSRIADSGLMSNRTTMHERLSVFNGPLIADPDLQRIDWSRSRRAERSGRATMVHAGIGVDREEKVYYGRRLLVQVFVDCYRALNGRGQAEREGWWSRR